MGYPPINGEQTFPSINIIFHHTMYAGGKYCESSIGKTEMLFTDILCYCLNQRMMEGNIFSLFTLSRGGGTPSFFLMGGVYPILPPDGEGSTLIQSLGLDGGTPAPTSEDIAEQSEHLLRGGWYASCVHAGELSC